MPRKRNFQYVEPERIPSLEPVILPHEELDHKRLRQWHGENPNISEKISLETYGSIHQPSQSSKKSLSISPHQLPVIPDTQFPENDDNHEYPMYPD